MSKRAVDWAVSGLRRLATQQAARVKPYQQQGKPIPPDEQIRRYLAGEERWRLDQGLVTLDDWAAYENEMRRMIAQRGGY